MSSWISIPLTVLITLGFIYELRGKGRIRESLSIVRSVRPIMVLTNLPVIALTTATGLILVSLSPVLRWSWIALLGNSSNVNFIGFQFAWFAPIFALLVLLALPLLAATEEKIFRAGTRDWKHGIKRSLVFCLIHIIAGFPLGFALAMTISGLWFTRQYFKGGVGRSTAYHTAWNMMLIPVVVMLVLK